MDTLTHMRSFIEVVRAGGYSAAARATGRSKAILSKDVRELEDFLGVRLLTRTTRSVVPTDAGDRYFEESLQVLENLDGMHDRIREGDQEPSGVLRVSAPRTYSEGKLGQAILDFSLAFPKVELDLVFEDRFVDMIAERFDVALRISELSDSSLIARKLCPFRIVVCASPDLIAKHGTPTTPDDMGRLPCISDSNHRVKQAYGFDTAEGRRMVKINPSMTINAPSVIRMAALRGLGFCQVPYLSLRGDIERGDLVPVLEEFELKGVGIFAVYPERRHMPLKLRAFVDFLVDAFAAERAG
ncbi:MAG: LysR substrate-binding domain-containing protein [Pseudomonadota bacterium]